MKVITASKATLALAARWPARRADARAAMAWCVPAMFLLACSIVWTGCSDSRSAGPATIERGERPSISFADITEEAGLGDFRHNRGEFGQAWAPEIVGAGGGFIDYDGDGWLDLLLVGGGRFRERDDEPIRALWLYRNNGDGTFADVTADVGFADLEAYGFGVVVADYDNDGDQDFLLTTLYEDMLFRNDPAPGSRVFTEVGKQAGIADRAEWSTSAIFFDADRDGHLDLYVGAYVDWSPEKDLFCGHEGTKVYCTPQNYEGIPGRYYHSNGDGTFSDRTEEAGFVPIPGKVFGVVEMDYNNDGWPDLYVTEDTERDVLFENNGDGTFVERGTSAGIAYDKHGSARAGMGADAGIVDSTGEVSLFVGNFADETLGVYRHTGGGLFVDRAGSSRLGHPSLMTLTFGLFLFDADLDGDLDLMAANGHVQTLDKIIPEGITIKQRPQLYLNDGDGVFQEYDPAGGIFAKQLLGRGAAYADFDRDGDLDVLFTENAGPGHLWRNDLENQHFLRVKLEGRASNRDAIGSRVVAVVNGHRMERRIRTGSSYLSQSEKTAVFGLGRSERVDTLLVYWPSGRLDEFTGIASDQEVFLIEGNTSLEQVPLPRRPDGAVATR